MLCCQGGKRAENEQAHFCAGGVRTLGSLLSRYIMNRDEADVSRGGVGSAAAFPARSKRKKIISPKIWRAGKEECAVGGCSRDYPATAQDHTHTTEGGSLARCRSIIWHPKAREGKKGGIAFRDTFYYPRLM